MNRWQRIALLASVLWIVGAVFAVRISETRTANSNYALAFRVCEPWAREEPLTHSANYTKCIADADSVRSRELKWDWPGVLFVAFVPLAVFWIVGYSISGVARWIRRGTKVNDHA
jgi:hypothetical protein